MTPAALSAWLDGLPTQLRRPLLLSPLLLWLATDALVPDLGFARDSMHVAVDIGGARWPLWAWLPVMAVLLIGVRGALGAAPGSQRLDAAWAGISNVTTWIALPAALLLALRTVSLWNPSGILFPWLGLVWSPHASVALALAPFLGNRDRSAAIRRRTAAVLFALLSALLGAYALYVCQMVMIHGDEAQYLRVTQSLLRDGDIDLANNLKGDATEFHVMDVGAHRAPGSPPGKVYSKHPAGLSVLLLPAYQLGLDLWDNPRLGAALAMSVCAAAIASLLYLWLCHTGASHSVSLWVTLGCVTTTPLFLFSTQIYPELPTVLVSLIVLLRLDPRWLRPKATAGGAGSPWEFAPLALLVGVLPFLHPRYAPLTALLGLGLLWQAHTSADRRINLGVVSAAGALCLVMLLSHNITVSGDWLGNFRPGNAWDEDALAPGTWWMSLPGHWLHVTKGLALNAPWFVVAVVPGLAVLAVSRDRRLLAVVALYTVTAVVNGIHPDWTFGFCLPSRFLITALPALALGAAAGLDTIRRTPWLGVLLCGTLAVSWDIIGAAVHIPELAFEGEHLPRAAIANFYPMGIHGFRHTIDSIPLPDLLLWTGVAAALIVTTLPEGTGPMWFRHRLTMPAVVTIALLGPALWGLAPSSASRLRQNLSPYLKVLEEGDIKGSTTLNSTFRQLREGKALEDGSFSADEDSSPGTLAAYYMPIQLPGLYRVVTRGVVAEGTQTAYVSHQRTLPALQPWSERQRIPVGAGQDGTFRFDYYHDRLQLGYLHYVYSGTGSLRFGHTTQDFHARRLQLRQEEAARFDFRRTPGPHAARDNLEQGRYLARFQLAGGALSTLTEKQPTPAKMAVVVSDGSDVPFERLKPGYDSPRRMHHIIAGPDGVQPQREALAAPWWASVPLVGDDVYELSFLVREEGIVWFLFQYDGPADLDLEEIVVYRQHLDVAQ